jgi:hypothetical protein
MRKHMSLFQRRAICGEVIRGNLTRIFKHEIKCKECIAMHSNRIRKVLNLSKEEINGKKESVMELPTALR